MLAVACTAGAQPARSAAQTDASDASRIPPASPIGRRAGPEVASLAELAGLAMDSRIGTYQARDARWVENQPVLVGRNFNFGVALGMEAGPGLAAAQRRNQNAQLAALLGHAEPIKPESLVRSLLQHCRSECDWLSGRRVLLYGIVYGDHDARMRVVLELREDPGTGTQYVAVSSPRPAADFADPTELRIGFDRGLAAIAELLRTLPPPLPDGAVAPASSQPTPGRCIIGDGTRVDGSVAIEAGEHLVLRNANVPLVTYIDCPREAFQSVESP
jgi:hypothetical protein